jgi:hypothetical protein
MLEGDWQRVFAAWPRWSSDGGELIWLTHGWRLVTTEDDSAGPAELGYNYIVLWLTEQEYTWEILKR